MNQAPRDSNSFVEIFPASSLARELEQSISSKTRVLLLQIKINQAPQVARLLEQNHLYAEEDLVNSVGKIIQREFGLRRIYRTGKHTFLVWLEFSNEGTISQLRDFARRSSPLEIQVNDSIYFPKLNIGATPVAGSIAETIFRLEYACDLASHASGGNLYISDMDDEGARSHIDLRRGLRDVRLAMREQQIGLFAQPIVNLHSPDPAIKKELLMRHYSHAEIQLPVKLLSTAEYNKVAQDLDLHIVELLARHYRRIVADNPEIESLSFNVSGSSYTSPRFVENLVEILSKHGVPRDRIILEVTENIANQDTDGAISTMNKFRKAGFQLALDDIGVGSSNFRNLFRFPVDYFKIDRSYCLDLLGNYSVKAFVKLIIDEAKRTQRKTVAEGIPDEQTLDVLRDMGLDYSQSFITGTPESFIEAPGRGRGTGDTDNLIT